MEKEENRPFYQCEDGFGVLLEGSCGFQIRDLNHEGKKYSCLTIRPLKHKQEPGTRMEDNEVMTDQGFMDLSFATSKSVDVFIECLQQMKEICFNDKTI